MGINEALLLWAGASFFSSWSLLAYFTYEGLWTKYFSKTSTVLEKVFVFFFWWIIAPGYAIAKTYGMIFKRNKK